MGFEIGLWAMVGFAFAAYAVVGNDALQTLGTFINANQKLHWFWLFLFAATILIVTYTYGWVINDGDPSWGRLANAKKYPVFEPEWYHALPPLALLLLTRFGIPVSTSFMVLTIFATIGGMSSMLQKSLIGYALAFVVGILVYVIFSRTIERFFARHELGAKAPWGLATVMGILIGVSVYYLPPFITSSFDMEIVQYGPQTLYFFPIAGVVIDAIAIMSVMRFTNGLQASAVAGFVAAIFAFAVFTWWPETQRLNFGIGSVGRDVIAALVGSVLFVTLFYVAERITSGRVVYWIILQWITTAYLWGIWLIQDFANIFVFLPRQLTMLESFSALGVITLLLAYTFANKGGPVQRILKSKTAVDDIRSAAVLNFVYASLLFFFKEVSDIPMSTTWVFLGLIAGREYAFAISTATTRFWKTVEMTLGDISKAYIGLVISIDLARGLPAVAKMINGMIPAADVWSDMAPSQATSNFIIIANLMLVPIFFYLITKSKISMAILTPLLAIVAWAFFTFPIA